MRTDAPSLDRQSRLAVTQLSQHLRSELEAPLAAAVAERAEEVLGAHGRLAATLVKTEKTVTSAGTIVEQSLAAAELAVAAILAR